MMFLNTISNILTKRIDLRQQIHRFSPTDTFFRRSLLFLVGRRWVRPLCLALLIVLSWHLAQQSLQNDIDTNRRIFIHHQNIITAFINEHPDADLKNIHEPESQALLRGISRENDSGNLVYLGELFLHRAHNDQLAQELFAQAIVRTGSATCPHQGLGLIYMRSGNFQAALRHKEQFIENSNWNGSGRVAAYNTLWSVMRLCRRLGLVDRAAHYALVLEDRAVNRTDRMLASAYLSVITLNFDRKPERRNSLRNLSDRVGLLLRRSYENMLQS